jgi:hypothetical protein
VLLSKINFAGCEMNKSTEICLDKQQSQLLDQCLIAYRATMRGDPRPVLQIMLATRELAVTFIANNKWAQIVNDMGRFINAQLMAPNKRRALESDIDHCLEQLKHPDRMTLSIMQLATCENALELHYRMHLSQFRTITEHQYAGTFDSASKGELWDQTPDWSMGGPGIRNKDVAPSAAQAWEMKETLQKKRLDLQKAEKDVSPGP